MNSTIGVYVGGGSFGQGMSLLQGQIRSNKVKTSRS